MTRTAGWVPATGLYTHTDQFLESDAPHYNFVTTEMEHKSIVFLMYLACIGDCFVRLRWKQL